MARRTEGERGRAIGKDGRRQESRAGVFRRKWSLEHKLVANLEIKRHDVWEVERKKHSPTLRCKLHTQGSPHVWSEAGRPRIGRQCVVPLRVVTACKENCQQPVRSSKLPNGWLLPRLTNLNDNKVTCRGRGWCARTHEVQLADIYTDVI